MIKPANPSLAQYQKPAMVFAAVFAACAVGWIAFSTWQALNIVEMTDEQREARVAGVLASAKASMAESDMGPLARKEIKKSSQVKRLAADLQGVVVDAGEAEITLLPESVPRKLVEEELVDLVQALKDRIANATDGEKPYLSGQIAATEEMATEEFHDPLDIRDFHFQVENARPNTFASIVKFELWDRFAQKVQRDQVHADRAGRFAFRGIPRGRYYVRAVNKTAGSATEWLVPVQLGPDGADVILSESNAGYTVKR